MKLVVISDTHGKHRDIDSLPMGEVLIHCGDFSNVGEKEDVIDFIEWFASFPHFHKIFIAGNHDRIFDPKFHKSEWDKVWLNDTKQYIKQLGLHYLENSEVTIDGVKFWGSPITPDFWAQYWAFNLPRGEKIAEVWNGIPDDTDVLITHGPAAHHLDWVVRGDLVGCEDLTYHIKRVNPMFHLFGHIHESYGIEETIGCTYVNASILNERYNPVNKPVELKINNDSYGVQ
jgi:Icc-related predicted phosphoesterase